jgi:predicted acyltransferase
MTNKTSNRYLSLDVFRGFIMFLLLAEFAGIFDTLIDEENPLPWLAAFSHQFHHHPWHGLYFWDLIQPFFMFMVGLAIPFAVNHRKANGASDREIAKHALQRSFWLLFLGWSLYCIGPGKIVFKFQNVLAQLSLTYFIAFLIKDFNRNMQLIISIFLLIGTEFLYRYWPIDGFTESFSPGKNFGTWLDLQYGGADMGGNWVSFNAIPTAAHTIWGMMAGYWLLQNEPKGPILKNHLPLILTGIFFLLIGYVGDAFTPIIKRISTTTFVFVSGGYSLLFLVLFEWLVHVLPWNKVFSLWQYISLNSLFIYLFAHIGGGDLIQSCLLPFSNALFHWSDSWFNELVLQLFVLVVFVLLCKWMNDRKIFLKI